MECPDCHGAFEENELIVQKQGGRLRPSGIKAHLCPFCGYKMSKEYTQRKNITRCNHSASVETMGEEYAKECSSCGGRFDVNGNLISINEYNNAAKSD